VKEARAKLPVIASMWSDSLPAPSCSKCPARSTLLYFNAALQAKKDVSDRAPDRDGGV